MLKLADVAPIPIANEPTATSVKAGSLRNIRKAWRRDLNMTRVLYKHVSYRAKPVENAELCFKGRTELGSAVRVRDNVRWPTPTKPGGSEPLKKRKTSLLSVVCELPFECFPGG
jgi:hypothetical protein